jgi:hypothetical protein
MIIVVFMLHVNSVMCWVDGLVSLVIFGVIGGVFVLCVGVFCGLFWGFLGFKGFVGGV